MIDCENAYCSNELSQTQSSITGLDLQDEEREIPIPGDDSYLDVSRKNLKEFPTHLYAKCLHVKHLYLEGNLLQELSSCFFPSLPSLQWLDLRNNLLRNLPKSVANHQNLEVLLLQGNQILALPLELGLVPKLRSIQLLGNPITFPPREVLEQGVHSIISFLQEEQNIQAPSPSTIRPIAEPFYKGVGEGLLSQKFKSKSGTVSKRRQSSVTHKRSSSSNLPVLMGKSYKKPGVEPDPSRPRSSVPMSKYKLLDTLPPEELLLKDIEDWPDLSNRLQSVTRKILQSQQQQNIALNTGRSRNEGKIYNNLLKELFMMRIRSVLAKQASTIQRKKDKEMLEKWRQNGAHVNHMLESGELPYDTDPDYMTMLSRVELQNPKMARQQQNKEAQTKAHKTVGEEMSEILKSLQELQNSRTATALSPHTEKRKISNEIQMLVQLQKKLQVLHFKNVQEDIVAPSFPV